MTKIAVLGPRGTFTDEAAKSGFPDEEFVYYGSITLVFEAVESGECEYGVVPIENSTQGSVGETIECLNNYALNIYGEIYYQILHVLAGKGKLEKIKKVMTHPQAANQCRLKLRKILGKNPEVVTKTPSGTDISTAGAIELVADCGGDEVAAIGSKGAAEKYGLKVLVESLADMDDNETRFFVISKKSAKKSERDKTSILVAVKDEAGALYKLLGIFDKAGVNLTKIESRLRKDKKWEYMFLIEFEGHRDEKKISKILKEVKEDSTYYKLLGSYPRA